MRVEGIKIGLGPKTSQTWLGLMEIVTVGQHLDGTPFFVELKNAATLQGRGQRNSRYHLASMTDPPTKLDQSSSISNNGLHPEYPTGATSRFRYSTSEPRSRSVSEGGSHPVTSTLW